MKAQFLLSALAAALVAAEELKVDVTHAVECDRKTVKGDKIAMHYHGTLADTGKKFDASYDRGQPLRFKLGSGQVIKGWDEGLVDMCIGEKRTLTIPPEFGYGQRAIGPIPAGSTLVFETELVEIEGVEPPKDAEPVPVPKVEDDAESESQSEAEPSSRAADEGGEGVAEKVAEAAAEAVDAAKTMIADTDDMQGHEEL